RDFHETGVQTCALPILTYMNLSGGPVAGLVRFYKVPPERLLVVHDEIDLPFGTLRAKQGGGEGGHNGLKSLSRSLGTRDYLRVGSEERRGGGECRTRGA